jgi:hypothetical protein
MSALLDAALGLAHYGPVFLMSAAKRPLTQHGSKDATRDETTITGWCRRWPDASPALLTGEVSKIVALDIDHKPGRYGLDTLEALGISSNPTTPTAHTPSGGFHWLFKWPGYFVKSSTDKIGSGVEIKGDSAWITLPPGHGRYWDPHLDLASTPLAPLPSWAIVNEPTAPRREQPQPIGRLSRYGEAALDAAVKGIIAARAGSQELTLNREAFSIGQLVAGNVIPAALGLDSLQWAARQMASTDSRRPWRPADLERKVRDAFTAGLREPRVAHG